MSAVPSPSPPTRTQRSVLAAAERACARIAPAWPLDQLIAVNPLWGWRDRPLADASARLAAFGRTRCLMPHAYYAGLWGGTIARRHLEEAAAELGVDDDVAGLLRHLEGAAFESAWHNVTDLADGAVRTRGSRMPWGDEVVAQISQFCGATFQRGGALATGSGGQLHLYRSWLDVTRHDHGIAVLMGEPRLPRYFAELPADHEALLVQAFDELGIDADAAADYAHALLMDVNGWASWIAYLLLAG